MARAFVQLRGRQGTALLQASQVNLSFLHGRRPIRSLAIIFALAIIFPLALFGLRSYAQNMTANHSHPDLEPASWPDNSLTMANLGHAVLLMNYFGTRVISDPSLFPRV